MMQKRRHYIYPDPDSLIAAFVSEVSNFLEESSELERPVHLAVSGGSTPKSIFRYLAETTRKEDWSGVHLYWGDERCVPPGDIQSNYGSTKRELIDPLGISDQQVHRIRGEAEPASESERYGQQLMNQLPVENGLPVFDWVWLGLGEDGHTASIFPDQIELWNAETPCVVASHPETGQQRISVAGNVINAARRVSFIAMGASKSQVINEIVMKEGRYLEYPAFYVSPNPGFLEWYLDKDTTNWL